MVLQVPNDGEYEMLADATNHTLTVKLFSNDATVDEEVEPGDLTEVATAGYSAASLDPGDRTITAGDPTSVVWPVVSFTFSEATTVRGYWVEKASDGTKVRWVEKFASAWTCGAGGGILKVRPRVTAS